MRILGIETSCDETAVAILEGEDFDGAMGSDGRLKLLSNVVVSQIDIFKAYGGVIPEVAARSHLEVMMPVLHQAFKEAGLTKANEKANQGEVDDGVFDDSSDGGFEDDWDKIDAIAVTHTPGLLGSLLVGTLTARTLAILHKKPLYAVHHLKSHIYANWLPGTGDAAEGEKPEFPLLALVISGGHTQIIYMREHNHFEIVGTTHDDAVGECFDKVAKILGLPYPGGPAIARAARGDLSGWTGAKARDMGKQENGGKVGGGVVGDRMKYRFQHPQLAEPLDFSFSGLKTAVLRLVQKVCGVPISYPSAGLKDLLDGQQVCDLAASFEQTAVEILLEKMEKALEIYPDVKNIVFAGGVSANGLLRDEAVRKFGGATGASERVAGEVKKFSGVKCYFPEPKFSGDNGAMVAVAAYHEILSGVVETDPYKLNIMPRSEIG